MNIFIIIITFLFMVGFYFMDAPDQKTPEQTTEYAMRAAGVNSVLECAAHVQGEAMSLDSSTQITKHVMIDNDTLCAAKYNIYTAKICTDGTRVVDDCTTERADHTITNYIITVAPYDARANADDGTVLNALAAKFADVPGFGIAAESANDIVVQSAGATAAITIPPAIVHEMQIAAGDIVYISEYAVAGRTDITHAANPDADIRCPAGTKKMFHFGKWDCTTQNPDALCPEGTLWDDENMVCARDDSAETAICGPDQTAVSDYDGNWTCVNPTPTTTCPNGDAPHLDYATMSWTCGTNPSAQKPMNGCTAAGITPDGVVGGGTTGTLRITAASSCTDCEKLVIDPQTCDAECVPDASKIGTPACYAGTCGGEHTAFYFGFDSGTGVLAAQKNIPELSGTDIPMDTDHSRNRMFNCLDCGTASINGTDSVAPYTAVCD